jgi:hypothetical protein
MPVRAVDGSTPAEADLGVGDGSELLLQGGKDL